MLMLYWAPSPWEPQMFQISWLWPGKNILVKIQDILWRIQVVICAQNMVVAVWEEEVGDECRRTKCTHCALLLPRVPDPVLLCHRCARGHCYTKVCHEEWKTHNISTSFYNPRWVKSTARSWNSSIRWTGGSQKLESLFKGIKCIPSWRLDRHGMGRDCSRRWTWAADQDWLKKSPRAPELIKLLQTERF